MKNVRQTNINIHRDSWVEINLENVAHNIKQIKNLMPKGKKLLAVVKADAYGHGSAMLAPVLLASGADMLGVASIDEGVDLRQAKINSDILVLGAVPVWAVETACDNDLIISVFSQEHLLACRQVYERTGKKPRVHIKLDTGMNRIGVSHNKALKFISDVKNAEYLRFEGIFTHLANSEIREKTQIQIDRWNDIISQIDTNGLTLHILNTAGIIAYDVPNSNMSRAGIALYGLYPDLPEGADASDLRLKPVLSLKARIVNIHDMKAGEGVSYGHTFIAKDTTKIATVPLGYADGVPRSLSNKIFGVLNDNEVKQIGNITMDQMMFDITGVDADLGDVITLLDENHSIDDWAKILSTINYELTCRLKVRLPRVYTR